MNTLANDVLLDGSFNETFHGVLLAVPQVLIVHKNRCRQDVFVEDSGRCTACDGTPSCYQISKPIRSEFPPNMKSNCRFRKRVGSRRKSVLGCSIKCVKTIQVHQCCPGFFGHECFKCPGEPDRWCSGRGTCQDGNLGNGECLCHEGFHGTSCEDCEPGRFEGD
ncbi:stabilin-2-like [Aplochiton taeniatus]